MCAWNVCLEFAAGLYASVFDPRCHAAERAFEGAGLTIGLTTFMLS
jgi:hypothetical protein